MKLIAVVLLTVAAATAPEIRYFRYQRAVQVPGNAAGQTCVALDAKTFEHSTNGLDDLRLYRGTTEVPFVLRNVQTVPMTQPLITAMNPGRRDGKAVFDAQMPEGAYSDVALDVSGRDFLATVTVLGGPDAAGAKTRIGSYTVFDFDKEKLGRSTVLHLPLSNFRWLHFEIAGPIEPGQVRGVEATQQPQEEPKYVAVNAASQLQQDGKSTVIRLSMPVSVPVDRIVFVPPAEPVNFSRDVNVTVEPVPPYTESLSQRELPSTWTGNLLRVHRAENGRRIHEERLAIDSSVATFRTPTKWAITVVNGDDTPIAFSSIRLEMRERDVCFEAVAGAAYTLYYGDLVLAAPKYDYAAWFTPNGDSVAATLGPEAPNAAYQRRPDMRPFTEKHPVFLWIALIVVVAILAVIALRSARRAPKPSVMP
jgi:hypothetical protein